jgi:predicted metal-dependent peptidase
MRLDISEQVKLTPVQMVAWEETLTAFSWIAPAFTSPMYEMLNPDRTRMVATFLGTSKVPAWFKAGTNGKRLFLVAVRFFELTLQERIFLLAHEVGHPMFGHIAAASYYRQKGYIELGFKRMPYNDMLANMAQDLVINDLLIDSRIGKFIASGLHDPTIATYRDSWIDVYERLLDEQEGPGKGKPCEDGEEGEEGDEPGNSGSSSEPPKDDGQKGRSRNGQKGFDAHMGMGEGEPKPGQDQQEGPEEGAGGHIELEGDDAPMTEEDLQRELQRAQQAVAAGIELARAQGKLPNALKMMCEKLLEPVVDWPEHIKSLFARKLGSGGYDFRRPDRRFLVRDIIVPGRSGFGANLIIGGGDSSGSIYGVPHLTDRFMAEFGGIMEDVNPREAHVVWCDAAIARVDVLTDMQDVHKMVHKGSEGGGGTDFRPVFEYAASLNADIDCLVYLTDGDGQFPEHAPKFPVIWADISGDPKKYPFGDVVHIPVPNSALNK